jgi:ubiquitin-protein ligase
MTASRRRILREIDDCPSLADPSSSIFAKPLGHEIDTIRNWQGNILGGAKSPFAGGKFDIAIDISSDYPFRQPCVKFVTKVYHPNVDLNTGAIALPTARNVWTPAMKIIDVLKEVELLLTGHVSEREFRNDEAAKLHQTDPATLHNKMRHWTQLYGGGGGCAFARTFAENEHDEFEPEGVSEVKFLRDLAIFTPLAFC